jgi:hypothetical protein
MIAWLLFLRLLVPRADVEAFRRTTPEPLDFDAATEHLGSARLAAFIVGVDADLVLSIAAHESRYRADAVGPEPGGRVSCGVMTPEPVARCPHQTVLEGYLVGARHLRAWIRATRDLRTALLGYAGGFAMIRACARGPVLRATGRHDDLCATPRVFMWRRDLIRRGRERLRAV